MTGPATLQTDGQGKWSGSVTMCGRSLGQSSDKWIGMVGVGILGAVRFFFGGVWELIFCGGGGSKWEEFTGKNKGLVWVVRRGVKGE